MNVVARIVSKNILFDYAILRYMCLLVSLSWASEDTLCICYNVYYRFTNISCVFTLGANCFLCTVDFFRSFFPIHWNAFFHIHNCERIAWLNFPYIPILNSILPHENLVFLFVSSAHFLFFTGATNCLCTFVLANIVACRCHIYNIVSTWTFFVFLSFPYTSLFSWYSLFAIWYFFLFVFLVECIQHWISFSKYTRFIRLYGFTFKLYLLSQYFLFHFKSVRWSTRALLQIN